MHGTYIDDVKVPRNQPNFVENGAMLLFGAEVIRGPGKTALSGHWSVILQS